jgi:putative copper export protein
MYAFYLLSVWLHIIAAAVWLGGMAFLALVIVPVMRKPEYREQASNLMQQTGLRFRWVGWICLSLLVLSGSFQLVQRGFGWDDVWSGNLFTGASGHTLGLKLLLVTTILGISAGHDFFIGPRATAVGQAAPGSPEALRLRSWASWIGRLNMLLALIVVALGVLLVRG